jgi:nucleoside-diphosphate-sugar epimerase
VLHFADRVSTSDIERYPVQVWKANIQGIMTALGIARAHSARFLYASTSDVYGNPEVIQRQKRMLDV